MASPHRPKTDRAQVAVVAMLAASSMLLANCTSCGDRTCRAYSNEDLARFASDPRCEAIAVYESGLETLDGLQGADKNIALVDNRSLMDVSAIDNARYVELLSSPLDEVAVTVAGIYLSGVPLRTVNLKLRWPVPQEPLDPDEPLPEVLNKVVLQVAGDGPSAVAITCADTGCRASVSIMAAALDATEISIAGVQIVQLGIMVGPLTSWEHLQGFGIPEREIQIRAPQDLELLREWRAWLDDNGFAGSLCVYEPSQECIEVTASPE